MPRPPERRPVSAIATRGRSSSWSEPWLAVAGGLGGCPYADSATGNLATEDLVWQLHGLGIETGIDLDALVRTSVWMAEQLGRPSASRTVHALAPALALGDPDPVPAATPGET